MHDPCISESGGQGHTYGMLRMGAWERPQRRSEPHLMSVSLSLPSHPRAKLFSFGIHSAPTVLCTLAWLFSFPFYVSIFHFLTALTHMSLYERDCSVQSGTRRSLKKRLLPACPQGCAQIWVQRKRSTMLERAPSNSSSIKTQIGSTS